jgi:arylsulfatase A-like enzyme
VGFLGYSRPVTPFLESLAKTSVVFSQAIVAGAPTYFSFPAIMAARYPLGLGREVLGIAPGEATIATVLQRSGYETAAFVAGNPYLTAHFGYDQGFAHFEDFMHTMSGKNMSVSANGVGPWSRVNRWIERFSRKTKITEAAYNDLYFQYCQWHAHRGVVSMDQLRRYPSADVLVNQAIDWIEALRDRPFFLWIHLMDPHNPYYPPEEALSSLGFSHISAQRALFLNSFWNRWDLGLHRFERHKEEIVTLYDAGVRWVDQQLARLVDALQRGKRWDDTVFAMTSDHGEEFLEHGTRYHAPGLAEELIHVPLLIRLPEFSIAKRVDDPFSLIHLASTLLECLPIAVPDSFQGRGLWSQISAGKLPDEPAIVECVACNNPWSVADRIQPRLMAVRDKEYKLAIRFRDHSHDLYCVKDDPLERFPVPADRQKEERQRLWRAAGVHFRQLKQRRDTDLALRARFREIRQQLNRVPGETSGKEMENPLEIAGHG